MPLDAQSQTILDMMSSFGGFNTLDPAALRQMETRGLPALEAERKHLASVRDLSIEGGGGAPMPIRIYTPREAERVTAPTPILVYFHGGGHVLGSLDMFDGLCCQLARGSGFIVVSVDYRLAPENKFPAAPEDAYAAIRWAYANAGSFGGDPSHIAIAGDSAGANLAAVACLMAKDRASPSIARQILFYPSTNGRQQTASSVRNGQGYLLTRQMMDWFTAQYTNGPGDLLNPYFAPLRHADHSGLPPAVVVTAEYDPLLDEGKAYADCLKAAGVPVAYRCYEGTVHGFVTFYRALDKGRDAIAFACESLRADLS
jgi:acetyl esterase